MPRGVKRKPGVSFGLHNSAMYLNPDQCRLLVYCLEMLLQGRQVSEPEYSNAVELFEIIQQERTT